MSTRVLLHVGTPKTGTSYLQDVLFRNRRTLEHAGIFYPAERFDAHFLAALDLMQLPWGGLESEAHGAWDRMAAAVRAWHGTAVISHEILATASRTQIARALSSLGHPDTEVHLVLSLRDLVRQIPAEWQENVKHRSGFSYHDFLATIRDPAREGRVATWFWGVQEIPDILNRWAADLPPERVHLVTVPAPGGPPDLLWERFCEALGLTGLDLDREGERTNPSLGAPETALLRRINLRANRAVPPVRYRPLVRELLAHQTLSRRTGSPRLTLPPDVHPWAQALAGVWIDEIKARGYHVVGDLGDLVGPPVAETYADPDHPAESEVADAAVDAIRALLIENGRLLGVEEHLNAQLEETKRALDRSYLRPTYRAREKIVRRLESGRAGRLMLRAYRFGRGRSSRSA
ncbi:MAG: hypothetical protein ACRDOZ_13875 [Nocardioides sp.]